MGAMTTRDCHTGSGVGWVEKPQRDRYKVAREVQGLPLLSECQQRQEVDGSWSLVCLTNTWFSQNTEQRHSKLRSRYERNRTEEETKWKNTLDVLGAAHLYVFF